MASTLRKRLSRRTATSSLRGATSDDDSSLHSSSEDMKSKLRCTKNDKPIARDDMTTTPPPSELKSARNESPNRSLLFRYKNRIAANQLMTTSPVQPSEPSVTPSSGRDAIFSEQFDVHHPLSTPESINAGPNHESGTIKETRTFDGVEFEMMSAQSAGAAPLGKARSEAPPNERRQTRSQTRRQQRIDSHGSHPEPQDLDGARGLTIRKVHNAERTPSPLAKEHKNDLTDTGLTTPTSAASNNNPHDLSAPSSPAAPDSVKSKASPSYLPIPSNSTSSNSKLSSYRRSQQAKLPKERIPAVSVTPPFFSATVPAGYLWVSHLGSSSRPSEPWGWLKKWTCCQCAVLDPNGHGLPAETMVEQKICSRLKCGHERCPLGCRVLRDQKYDIPGVFA